MYLRMLKKDLKDKVGLNIVLCIFMIIAATLLVTSAGFIYTFFVGAEKTYEKCNTSDVIFTVQKSISDEEGQRKKIKDILDKYPEISETVILDRAVIRTARLDVDGVDRRSVTNFYESSAYLSPVTHDQNIPYDMNDEILSVEDGCIAIPEYLANNAKTKVGEKMRITTDMGNTYEFVISDIYKDPSSNYLHKIILSDNDYAEMIKEFNNLSDFYEIKLDDSIISISDLIRWGNDIILELNTLSDTHAIEGVISNTTTGKNNLASNEALITVIISIFMVIMGVSLIILIFMSIRFSLHATIKREEKEIGTMKAIGVDNIAYKSLFIVKYIVFSIVGSVLGTVFGIILCRFMINRFILNTLTPEFSVFLIIGIIMSLSFMLLMVIFSFLTLGRMRKISVMDTIHGENRGERFTKIPGVFLHKSRKISVPFFLAAQDVTGRIRRYIYLVISYSLGLVLLLMVSQLKDTVVSHDFRTTYWQIADRELFIRPEDNLRDKLISQEGSYRNVFLYYERYYNEHGIPLNIQITDIQIGNIILRNGTKVGTEIFFDNEDVELERMVLVDGGKTPSLENEIAISHFLKDKEGINLGDTVTLEYKIYKEDGFTQETIRKDFIVTAFVESMAMSSMPRVYMAENDENIVADNWDIFNEGLDVPDDEYDETIEKMRAVNEDILIWDFDQVLDYDLGNKFGVIFDLLMITMAIVMTLTLFAMTFLYQQIFIEEETADIAMLKSLGVSGSSIRRWQYLRILMLVMIAIVISVILAFTASKALFGKIGVSALGVAKFTFASPSIFALIVFPLGLIILVMISLMLSFRPIDNIQIWRVRNE